MPEAPGTGSSIAEQRKNCEEGQGQSRYVTGMAAPIRAKVSRGAWMVSGRGRDLQRVPALGTQHSQTTSTPDYLEAILQLAVPSKRGRPNVMTMMKVV